MELKQITDIHFLLELLSIDKLYQSILAIEDLEKLKTQLHVSGWFYGVEDHYIVGLLYVKHFEGNCFSFHGGLYKEFRGKGSEKYLKESLEQLRKISPNATFLTTVNSNNKLAIALDRRAGLKECMRIKQGYSTGDLVILAEA